MSWNGPEHDPEKPEPENKPVLVMSNSEVSWFLLGLFLGWLIWG